MKREKLLLCCLLVIVVILSGCAPSTAPGPVLPNRPAAADTSENPEPADQSPEPLSPPSPRMSPLAVNFDKWSDEGKGVFFDLAVMQNLLELSGTYGLDNVTVGMLLDSKMYVQDEPFTMEEYINEILTGTVFPLNFPILPVGSCETGVEPTFEQRVFSAVNAAVGAIFGFTPGEVVIPNKIVGTSIADAPLGTFPFDDGFMRWEEALRVLGKCGKYRVVIQPDGSAVKVVSREQELEAKVTRSIIDVGGMAGFGFLVYSSGGAILFAFGPAVAQYATAAPN